VSSTAANGRKSASEPSRLSELDEDFYEQVSAGLDARYSEYWLRACFQEHAQLLICDRQRSNTSLVSCGQDDPSSRMVMQFLEQLRAGSHISDTEMQHSFTKILDFMADEARLEQLLSMLPASSPLGCLAPISGALFHSNSSVRGMAATILRALEEHKTTRTCVSGLNPFLLQGLAIQSRPSGTWA